MGKTGLKMLTLLAAGSVLFCGFSGGRVKKGVTVNGVEVGGLPFAEAERRVRETLDLSPFILKTPSGEASFFIDCGADLFRTLRKAKRGERVQTYGGRAWVNAEEDIAELCKTYAYSPVDAQVSFSPDGRFTYIPDKDGLACLYEKTLCEALSALREGKSCAELYTAPVKARVTVEDLKAQTRLLASFTTYFDGSNAPRVHNIALACAAISGKTLAAGETFSFNETVGKRTKENGYKEAPVILEGQFVSGVGGGVCQASTTLMNCAVRAGLTVTKSHAHSLSVGYVPPSCDAMVSEYSDLEFKNPYGYPVYIAAKTGQNSVTFSVFGAPDGREYKFESNVLFRIAPPPEKLVEGTEEKVLRKEKEGIASESYICVYEKGKLVQKTLFRRDGYAVVQGIRQTKPAEEIKEGEEEKEGELP